MTDQVYREIKDRILTLELPPGRRVTEDQVVEILDNVASKTPVRDALRWLVKEGFVHKLGRSYRIAPITIRDTRDLFVYRTILESAAARRVIERHANVDQLVAFQTQTETAYNRSDPESIRKFLCSSDEFHLAMARASSCRPLAASLALVLEKLQPVLQIMLRSVAAERLAVCEHDALAAAFSSRDAGIAVAAVEEHLRVSEELVIEALSNLDGEVQLPPEMTTPRPNTPVARNG